MTKTRTTILEQFLLLFNVLKDTANGDPERVKIFYSQHAEMRTAAHHLLTFVWRGDFHRRVLHGPKKYHWQVPEGFQAAYKNFIERWEPALTEARLQYMHFRAKERGDKISWDFLDFLTEDNTINLAEGDTANKASSNEDDDPKPKPGDEDYEFSEEIGEPNYFYLSGGRKRPMDPYEETFDPLIHDGANTFRSMFACVEGYADEVEEDGFYQGVHVDAKTGLEAYEYLTETIGFDPDGVFRRWDKVPVIFMPAHVSNKHGLEKGSLNNLIDDAVKAYVFGAPAAAIAICRAALEMILKQHYKLDYKEKGEKGRVREKGLGGLIFLADKKYDFVPGPHLHRYSKTANRIMHSYNRDKPLSDEDEKIILDFIRTLKFLIERAPDP